MPEVSVEVAIRSLGFAHGVSASGRFLCEINISYYIYCYLLLLGWTGVPCAEVQLYPWLPIAVGSYAK